ncbi:hypothetical protein HGRIS_008155 [Hohenbuehelia grisea]|uniref:C3H1-type domain-containing protein n=1 Tax=Hohenbuehelia grisea TaxID=104357 RepID=A0ABR3J7I7_9AGAR
MVSALWKACSEGNLETVQQLLRDASSVDIEIKDHTGATPLIEAVKNGHLEVVRALLDKGADPTNRSSQGLPEQYTSDSAILDLLHAAKDKLAMNGVVPQENGYTHDPQAEQGQAAYPPQGEMYTYYPTLNSAPPPLPEGAVYYPAPPSSQPMQDGQAPGDARNLPPPDIARFIPCRYFPACRYGGSCMFLHPPQTPFFPGPIPAPAQYAAPYDPMVSPPYPPNYYVPQPGYQPPNGAPAMSPMSPPSAPIPPMMHARSSSEIVSPSQQGPFSPQTAPPTLPYGPMSPISTAYHPGPPIPMSIPPLPPAQPQGVPPPPGPQSPPMFNGPPGPVPPYGVRPDAHGQYPPPNAVPPVQAPLVNGIPKPQMPPAGPDAYPYRDAGHPRRGNGRRGSLAGRKPPCFFFPAGRCKNGDDCRFPHVMPEIPAPHAFPHHAGRGVGRPKPPMNGVNGVNGFNGIEEKLANMGVRDPRAPNGVDNATRPQPTDAGGRPRFNGLKTNQSAVAARDKKPAVVPKPYLQRVPNADDFPVLAGSTTPPTRSPGLNGITNGFHGPTAAQVLQAPPPFRRRDSTRESSTRGTSPDSAKGAKAKEVEPNGTTAEVAPEPTPVPSTPAPVPVVNKLPISFAAVTSANAPEVSNQVSVSA